MRRIMLTGKNGQLGWELQRSLMPLGRVVALGRADLDLAEPDSIRKTVRAVRPDVIVNAAAYTAVDKAEQEPDVAMAVNGVAPCVLAEEAKRVGAALVHYSTDYVFDGDKSSPYTEDDAPNPLNVYGRTKLVGEQAIEAAGVPHLILRTSWVYGARGKNFLLTVLRLAEQRRQLRVVADQVGTPNWSRALAAATAQILAQCYSPRGTRAGFAENNSVYHLSGSAHTSWYGLARAILEEGLARSGCVTPEVIPIGSVEHPTAARRPKNSVLANGKIVNAFGLTIRHWHVDVRHCMREVARASDSIHPGRHRLHSVKFH
jgi:dTDP-4-dehydrorhamnose reductase